MDRHFLSPNYIKVCQTGTGAKGDAIFGNGAFDMDMPHPFCQILASVNNKPVAGIISFKDNMTSQIYKESVN